MGAPQTLPATFSGWDKPPDSLPANFSQWDQARTAARPPVRDRLAEDRATTEAWAQNHPILGPIARFLVTAGQTAGNAITDTPGQLYHAIVDPPTLDEASLTPEQRVVSRLGGKQAIQAAQDYASGKVTARGAASVLPEALGTGVGQVTGGAAYGKLGEVGPEALSMVADAASPAIRATVRGINKGLVKAPGTIGGTTGAAVGGYLGGHVGAEIGGAAGAMAGREILPQVRLPGEGFGLPNRVTGGPEVAPPYEAPSEAASAETAPETPLPKVRAKVVKQSTALGPTAQVRNQAEALGPRSIVTDPATGQPEFSDVVQAKQAQVAPQTPRAVPTPETQTPAAAPVSAPEPAASPAAAKVGPAADDLLAKLRENAAKIEKQEASEPGSADEDLTQKLQDSLAIVRARKAAQAAQKAQGGASRVKPRSVVLDPSTGRPEFSDVLAAKGAQ